MIINEKTIKLIFFIFFTFIVAGCKSEDSKIEVKIDKKVPAFLEGATLLIEAYQVEFDAAKSGDRDAAILTAARYLNYGFANPDKQSEALEYIRDLAESGDLNAMDKLSRVYLLDSYKDIQKSELWKNKYQSTLISLAEKGDASAMSKLGNIYSLQKQNGCDWFKRAAAAGNADGMYGFGNCLLESGSFSEAINQFQEAAKANSLKSIAKLIEIYRSPATKDEIKEKYFYENLIKLSDRNENFSLGSLSDKYCKILLDEKVNCSNDDFTKALTLKELAAKNGSIFAATELALYYQFEKSNKFQSEPKAFNAHLKAAKLGSETSMVFVGKSYLNGEMSAPKDYAEAFNWFKRAAMLGDDEALFNIGWMYATGTGVKENPILSYAYGNLAVSQADKTGFKKQYSSGEYNKYKEFVRLKERLMTKDEVEVAQALTRKWKRGFDLEALSGSSANTEDSANKLRTGTVFFINKDGFAITNHHVISGCKSLKIPALIGVIKKISEDSVNDLALLKYDNQVENFLPINSSSGDTKQGEEVFVFGYPMESILSSGGNITPGIITAKSGLNNNSNQIQISAPIQPGSSGSPVMNNKGEVVGVVTMKINDKKMLTSTGSVSQNVNFAVNGQTLNTFLQVNKVEYKSGGFFSLSKDASQIADLAKKATYLVECH